jgi:hypothetical protein
MKNILVFIYCNIVYLIFGYVGIAVLFIASLALNTIFTICLSRKKKNSINYIMYKGVVYTDLNELKKIIE